MIYHSAVLKTKAGLEASLIDSLIDGIRALKNEVPVIREIWVGRNFTDRSQGFDIGMTVVLNSVEDIDRYIHHPEHQKLLNEKARPILEDLIVVDYES